MKHIFTTFSLILLLGSLVSVHAQNSSIPFGSRLYTGGGLGFQFGNVTIAEVSPLLGYKITPQLDIGFRTTYQYYSVKDYRIFYLNNYVYKKTDLEAHVFGGGPFIRYYLDKLDIDFIRNLFLHTEYEYLSYSFNDYDWNSMQTDIIKRKRKVSANNIYIGGGLSQPLSAYARFYLLFLYNINEGAYSTYSNPLIRVGFDIGF